MEKLFLIDSCGWLEYFTDGKLADAYYSYLKRPAQIITASIIIYEVYKKIKRERGEEAALLAIAQIKETQIIPLNESIALLAGDLSLEYKIPMADALIYATAKSATATVVTSDTHFKNLPGVVYL